MLVVPLVAHVVAHVVEQRRGVEQDPIARPEAVVRREIVEELHAEAPHEDAVRLVELVAAAEAQAGVGQRERLAAKVLGDEVRAREIDEHALLQAHARRGDRREAEGVGEPAEHARGGHDGVGAIEAQAPRRHALVDALLAEPIEQALHRRDVDGPPRRERAGHRAEIGQRLDVAAGADELLDGAPGQLVDLGDRLDEDPIDVLVEEVSVRGVDRPAAVEKSLDQAHRADGERSREDRGRRPRTVGRAAQQRDLRRSAADVDEHRVAPRELPALGHRELHQPRLLHALDHLDVHAGLALGALDEHVAVAGLAGRARGHRAVAIDLGAVHRDAEAPQRLARRADHPGLEPPLGEHVVPEAHRGPIDEDVAERGEPRPVRPDHRRIDLDDAQTDCVGSDVNRRDARHGRRSSEATRRWLLSRPPCAVSSESAREGGARRPDLPRARSLQSPSSGAVRGRSRRRTPRARSTSDARSR